MIKKIFIVILVFLFLVFSIYIKTRFSLNIQKNELNQAVSNNEVLDISKMKDIYDIIGVKNSQVSGFIFYPFLIVLFYLLFYIILKSFFNLNKNSINKSEYIEKNKENLLTFQDKIINELEELRSKINFLEKEEFYTEFNFILRKYLDFKGLKGVENKTFSDLKKYLKEDSFQNTLSIFEKTYFFEFNLEKDNKIFRNNIIDEFLLTIRENINLKNLN